MNARRRHTVLLGLLAGASLAAAGCPKPIPEVGPMEPLIQQHNQNAAKVPQLGTEAQVTVTLIDAAGHKQTHRLTEGDLFLQKSQDNPLGPQDFVLRGRMIGREIFRLGSDATHGAYYLAVSVSPRVSGSYWGRYDRLAATSRPATMIDPTQLLSVLERHGLAGAVGAAVRRRADVLRRPVRVRDAVPVLPAGPGRAIPPARGLAGPPRPGPQAHPGPPV